MLNTRGRLSPELNVLLLWHSFQSDNLGVGALTVANISILQSAAEAARVRLGLTILGPDGSLDYSVPGVHQMYWRGKRDLFPRSPVWRAIRETDLVLDIGGGDSFTDLYG